MGKKISIDWNFAPSIWQDDGKLIFTRICKNRPLLKMSMDDVERFLGKQVSEEEARNYLSTLTTTVTCLTCGKDGVWYSDNNDTSWKYMPAISVAEVRDTTGAGDAFWSGFLHAYLAKAIDSQLYTGRISDSVPEKFKRLVRYIVEQLQRSSLNQIQIQRLVLRRPCFP